MKIWHMNGAGNDFMVMDARNGTFDFAALAVKFFLMRAAVYQ